MKVLFVVPYPVEAASTRYRVEQYLPYLCENGIEPVVSRFIDSSEFFSLLYQPGHITTKTVYFTKRMLYRLLDLLRIHHFDVIFVQREALPIGPPLFERLVSYSSCRMIFDFDDAIYLSHSSKANRWISWIKNPEKTAYMIRYSNHVVVGNETLRRYALKHNKNVSVVPTSIDLNHYTVREEMYDEKPITIGWVGSGSTIEYLHQLDNVFRELDRRYDIQISVVGGTFKLSGVNLTCRPWSLKNELTDLHSFDIGIMPLPDDKWTRGKGGFKAIQYMAVGLPSVISPVGINNEIIVHGVNGYLADSDEEWFKYLAALIEDFSLRRQLGLAGRATVAAHYSTQVNGPKLLDILRSAN